jgi:hypothetical protein|tara:strand:- start:1697 stop:2341 length:645 start_codon:yes stop_codon:yes gene_type:complete
MAWTFTTLKTAIQDYVDNTETTFVNNLDEMIRIVETRIFYAVQLPMFRRNVTGSLTSGGQYLSQPTDFIAALSFAVTSGNNRTYLLPKDVNYINEAYPDSTETGLPKYYGIFDDDFFIVGPTPDSGYATELHYAYQPESITVSASGTSWLGDNAEDALLYGCLVEAYTFMKGEPDLITNYTERFAAALQRLGNLGEARNRRDQYRNGALQVQET